jgi:hypothetical protein
MLWFWRTESPSCSTWQIEQHSSHSNHQRRRYYHPRNGHWNGSYPPKIRVERSTMLPTRCRWSSIVQGPPCGSKGLWASPQDHGRCPLLTIFYSSRNKQDVLRFEELLVDTNEARDCKVCVQMWHLSKNQSWAFETRQKSTTLEHSWVEMGKYLYGLHCGFAPHLAWV